MSSSAKKILGGVILLVLVGAWWGYSQWVKHQEELFRSVVMRLPESNRPTKVEWTSFTPGLFDRSLHIEGLQMLGVPVDAENTAGPRVDCKVKSARVSGVNLDAFNQPGIQELWNTLSLEGLEIDMAAPEEGGTVDSGFKSSIKYASIQMDGVAMDAGRFAKAWEQERDNPVAWLGVLKTVKIKHISLSGQETQSSSPFFSQEMHIGMASADNVSVLQTGHVRYSDIWFKTDGQQVLAIGGVEVDGLSIPDILNEFYGLPSSGTGFAKAFEEKPLALERLAVKDIRISIPGIPANPNAGAGGTDVLIKEFNAGLHVGGKNGSITLSLDSLHLPADVVAMLPLSLNPFLEGKSLLVSKGLEADWAPDEKGTVQIHVKKAFLTEPELGSVSVQAKLAMAPEAAAMMGLGVSPQVGASFLSVSLEDKQLINTLVGMDAGPMLALASDPLQRQLGILTMRGQIADEAEAEIAGNPDAAQFFKNVASLLRNAGSLTIEFTSDTPVEIGPDKLSQVKTTYTPPVTPPFPSLETVKKKMGAVNGTLPE